MADEIPADKKPWESKTVWAALLMAVLGFIPAAQVWISAHPEMSSLLAASLMAALRKISNGKVVIS